MDEAVSKTNQALVEAQLRDIAERIYAEGYMREKGMDDLQNTLDNWGYAPFLGEPADAINGVIHLLRGNTFEAGVSAASFFMFGDLLKNKSRNLAGEAVETIGESASNILNKADNSLINTITDQGLNISDDTLVHFSPGQYPTVNSPTGSSYWYKWGDINNLSPTDVQLIIGDIAEAGQEGGAKFMHIAPDGTTASFITEGALSWGIY